MIIIVALSLSAVGCVQKLEEPVRTTPPAVAARRVELLGPPIVEGAMLSIEKATALCRVTVDKELGRDFVIVSAERFQGAWWFVCHPEGYGHLRVSWPTVIVEDNGQVEVIRGL